MGYNTREGCTENEIYNLISNPDNNNSTEDSKPCCLDKEIETIT